MENNPSNKSKHAFCVMAHDDAYCLKTLIKLIDSSDTDIFLHIDKKSSLLKNNKFRTDKSRLIILDEKERVNVNWGGLSQVKAEINLFRKALDTDNYRYIHLLSGADLPLKPIEKIINFYNNLPPKENIVNFSYGETIDSNVEFKTLFFHPFVEYQRYRKDGNPLHSIQDFGAKLIRNLFVKIQKIIKFQRDWKNLVVKKGSQWVSITPKFARYLVQQEKFILKRFKGVICPDEIFIHTMIYNSEFRNTIHDYDNKNNESIRLIDWKRGFPYVWKINDKDELLNCKALFARKFSSSVDKEIIDVISKSINN